MTARFWPGEKSSWQMTMVCLRVFSHENRFEIAMTNCKCDIFELPSVHTREKTSLRLRVSIPERGEEVWLVSVSFWHADCYFYLRSAVYRRKWLESHVAPPPKSQGIHTVISLHYCPRLTKLVRGTPPNEVSEGTMKRAPYVCVWVRPCVRAQKVEICFFSVISWPILILFVLSDRAWWGLQNFYTEFWN